ncbi:MAG: putative lipid II flippase FtsW, partial [Chloroflexi bacterium]|nr:putative lipid II flippase FtsW [Chloroflexota bacterium]
VYSSSAIKAFLSKENNTFAIVGPQIQWAALGLVAMLVMMRIDYRWLRVASVPLFLAGIVGLLLVFIPAINIVIGGSARWVQIGPLPAVHPAEFMKLALVVYLAHWFAKRGTAVHGLLSGTVPFLVITVPVIVLVLIEPDLGTSSVLAFTAFTMFFLAGANVLHLAALVVASVPAVVLMFMRGYQMDRIEAWLNPWTSASDIGFHSIQGYFALALGGVFGAGLGESRLAGGLFLPNAFNDFIFAIIGEEFGLLGAGLVIVLFLAIGYLGIRTSLGAPDTFGAMLAAGITAWICLQAFINIGVVVSLIPVTGIPLPFVSAGGSSLVISFAAVGILLSISRETVEKGTWNDAPADRGRGDGRSHLPGPRRRPVTPRSGRNA